MRPCEPKVFLISESRAVQDVMEYLKHVGVPDWKTDSNSDAEGLLELAGRACYKSFAPGLNPNVTTVREGNTKYLRNIIEQHHGSVLEHATASFALVNVSRVFTHELARHRVGTAISQESLRYVRVREYDFWMPECIQNDYVAYTIFQDAIEVLEEAHSKLTEHFKLDEPGANFSTKKKITSALRRIAPHGMATAMIWSANFRTLRHVIEARTDPGAEEEIRMVFGMIAKLCVERWPNVFGDYESEVVDGHPWYRTANTKV